ncbi:MAG: hypothetical protein RBG13Loki_0949 [Promethearchaeota archaeon CR_4]|nr:MAG: hypothetical protein RBG13Loki_0949 [Candidatus Lokiarchaeota archaeon CR_4]
MPARKATKPIEKEAKEEEVAALDLGLVADTPIVPELPLEAAEEAKRIQMGKSGKGFSPNKDKILEFVRIWNKNVPELQLSPEDADTNTSQWPTNERFLRYKVMFEATGTPNIHPKMVHSRDALGGWSFAGFCLIFNLPFDLQEGASEGEIARMTKVFMKFEEYCLSGFPYPVVGANGKLNFRNKPMDAIGFRKKLWYVVKCVQEVFSGATVASSSKGQPVNLEESRQKIVKDKNFGPFFGKTMEERLMFRVVSYASQEAHDAIGISPAIVATRRQKELLTKRSGDKQKSHDALTTAEIQAINIALMPPMLEEGQERELSTVNEHGYVFEDWVLWEYALDMGFRAQEIATSQWEDLIEEKGILKRAIKIRFEKTKKHDLIVPISVELWRDLQTLKTLRSKTGLNDHGFLFVSSSGNPYIGFTPKGIENGVTYETIDWIKGKSFDKVNYEWFMNTGLQKRLQDCVMIGQKTSARKALEDSGVAFTEKDVNALAEKEQARRNLTSHSIRATFATMMWARSRDAVRLSYMMGHLTNDGQPDLEQSQKYIHQNWDDLNTWYLEKEKENTMSIVHYVDKSAPRATQAMEKIAEELDNLAEMNRKYTELLANNPDDPNAMVFEATIRKNKESMAEILASASETQKELFEVVRELKRQLKLKSELLQSEEKVNAARVVEIINQKKAHAQIKDEKIKAFIWWVKEYSKGIWGTRPLAEAMKTKFPKLVKPPSYKTLGLWYGALKTTGTLPEWIVQSGKEDYVREQLAEVT